MGLLYVFPVSETENDFYSRDDQQITLKTYGLPYIFWIYAFCILSVILFMTFSIWAPIQKLMSVGDSIDIYIGKSILSLLILSPVILLSFFFYEKRIIKTHDQLIVQHFIWWIKIKEAKYSLNTTSQLSIETFLDSPNVAKLNSSEETRGFENKGYFILYLLNDGKKIFIDRHSRKKDLVELKNLLNF